MLSSASRFRARGTAVSLSLALAGMLAACGGAAGPASSGGPGPDAFAPGPTAAPVGQANNGNGPGSGNGTGNGNGNSDGNGNGGGGGGGGNPAAPANLLIIKSGTLNLQVAGIDEALDEATRRIVALGGYVSGSQRAGDAEHAAASVTFRIPADRWEDALVGLRGVAETVIDERTGTQDVTGQVIDLGARIRNLQATETALQGIMDRAVDIEDVLTVQAELTRVRSEIEQLTAQKGGLEEQAAYSTLTVGFQLKPAPPVVAVQEGYSAANEVDRASASLVGLLQGLATAGIWFGIVWLPILFVIGALTFAAIAVGRRLQRPSEAAVTPTAGTGA